MLLPIQWLKEYVKIEESTKEISDKLTLSGSHVDAIVSLDKEFTKVVIGHIKEIEKHPDADKLVVTQIDVGEEELLQIVTGANNINVGDYVPVALVGSRLPGGVKIKKGKLRGVPSLGMLCSTEELGISDSVAPKESKDGIWILHDGLTVGEDVKTALELDGEVLDIEITPNRPDCLSIIGMARETAATFKLDLNEPIIEIKNEVEHISDYMDSIEVRDTKMCPRYYGRVVKDVKVGPSPYWMQKRLMDVGMRPINNIVDITNYVMNEIGQPLHAFDYNKLDGKKIIVKAAQEGQKYVTLDEEERVLKESMLMICDGNKEVAIAGVMGGGNSEVSSETKTLFLESANFNGRNIRLTAKALGMRTDASAKFEKDIDPNLAEIACERACQLIEMIGAGTIVKGHLDEYPVKREKSTVEVRPEKVNKLLGSKIETNEMLDILNHLEIESKLDNNVIVSKIPTYRNDIKIEADLIEEIGRIYGFDNIETKPFLGPLTKGYKSDDRIIDDLVKEVLMGAGLNEITTYSFISPKAYDKIALPKDSIKRKVVEIINPLGEDFSVMRTTMMPNMLEVLSRNYKYGVNKAWAYETGNVFIPTNDNVKTLPHEIKTVCIGLYGNKTDFYKLKSMINEILAKLGIKDCEYIPEKLNTSFHPGRTANLIRNNQLLGILGEVHPIVLENYGIKERVYVAELSLETLGALATLTRKYSQLPKYPAITRDIALVVDRDLLVGDIYKTIKNVGGKLVEDIKLFDIYTGEQIESDKKSVAYSISYRSYEKTLQDDDIKKTHEAILNALETELKAILRK